MGLAVRGSETERMGLELPSVKVGDDAMIFRLGQVSLCWRLCEGRVGVNKLKGMRVVRVEKLMSLNLTGVSAGERVIVFAD